MFHDGNQRQNLPRHVAIIMDGNGRWAQQRLMPRSLGHREGAKAFKRIVRYCATLGIETLTVFAFSTENWLRPPEEVGFIMELLEKTFYEEIDELDREGVRVRMVGSKRELSPSVLQLWERAEVRTRGNTRLNLCVAFNYGGRSEIVEATRQFAERVSRGACTPASLDEDGFAKLLFTAGSSNPDLVIRTGGEYRVSNFLLWQAAYAEWVFSDSLWPDFDEEELDKALASYARRVRRFGRVQAD